MRATRNRRLLMALLAILAFTMGGPAQADPTKYPDAEESNLLDQIDAALDYTGSDNLSCLPEAYGTLISNQVNRPPVPAQQAKDIGVGRGTCVDITQPARAYKIKLFVVVEAYFPGSLPPNDWRPVAPNNITCQSGTLETPAIQGQVTTLPVGTPVCIYAIGGTNVNRSHRAHTVLTPYFGTTASTPRDGYSRVWYVAAT